MAWLRAGRPSPKTCHCSFHSCLQPACCTATRRKQEELSFTAQEALLSTQQNPCCLLKVCIAVTTPCPREGFRAKYSHCQSHPCSPWTDPQPPLWSSAQPLSHSYQVRHRYSEGRGTEPRGAPRWLLQRAER